ncbi:hypothetical protein LIER_26409 [Lithospermum erythrorhizon]|uniref:Uncharacterized protein n=1 Tax=Lithospermum erythrorhizon TaxID=34254 RepID=A0AAV3R9Q8_LITER
MKFYLLGHDLWDIVNGNDTTPPREVRSTTTTSDTSTSTPSTPVRPVVVDQRIAADLEINESPTKEDWDFETSFFVEEVDVVDVQGKDLVEEYALSMICEYSGDLNNDEIIDLGGSNHIIRDEVKVYKDLKVTNTPILERREIEVLNVMLAEEVNIDKVVLPYTEELQEKLQIKLQLGPSQDVANQKKSKNLKLSINAKFQELEFQSKSKKYL